MKRIVQIIGWVLTFASIYAICNIELDWFWSIPVKYNPENINRVLLNLSYSYLAGYIFYLLVTEIPYLHRKQRFCKLLSKKYDSLKNQIETHIQAFDTKEHYHLDKITRDELYNMIVQRDLCDNTFYANECGITQSIIRYINKSKEIILDICYDILNIYKEYLSDNQIETIESIIHSAYFNLIDFKETDKLTPKNKEMLNFGKKNLSDSLYEVIELVRKLK